MKVLLLLLLAIALICVGCSGSSYITQDTYLAHQGFIELSKGNYAKALSGELKNFFGVIQS